MILGGPPEESSNLYRVEFTLLIGDLGAVLAAGTLAVRRSVIVIPLAAVGLGVNVVATVALDYLELRRHEVSLRDEPDLEADPLSAGCSVR